MLDQPLAIDAMAVDDFIVQNDWTAQNQTEYREHYDALVSRYEDTEKERDAIADQISQMMVRRRKLERFIETMRGINRAGWVGNEFYPYEMKDAVQFYDDETGTTNLVEALHTHGSEEKWLELAARVRTYPFARFMLAVCFAAPLLHLVSHRNIYTHIWYESRGGKTAVAKLGLGIWGNPEQLLGTYNATLFGLEQRCATLKHLPVALDELQSLKQK